MKNYFSIETYKETIQFLQQRLPSHLQQIKLGIVCGSGLGGLVECFDETPIEFSYTDLPHFIASTGLIYLS
jgi:purine-nucleoside phosphorylase